MNLADYVDGGNLLAMEIAGIALLFLVCVCATGVLLLSLYFFAKAVQALVRFAVRQLRARAFTTSTRADLVGQASACGFSGRSTD